MKKGGCCFENGIIHRIFSCIGFVSHRSNDAGGQGILRAKGIVPAADGKWIHFDHVPGEIDVRYGPADVIGKLCVIGSKIDEAAIAELFGV